MGDTRSNMFKTVVYSHISTLTHSRLFATNFYADYAATVLLYKIYVYSAAFCEFQCACEYFQAHIATWNVWVYFIPVQFSNPFLFLSFVQLFAWLKIFVCECEWMTGRHRRALYAFWVHPLIPFTISHSSTLNSFLFAREHNCQTFNVVSQFVEYIRRISIHCSWFVPLA